MREGELDRGFHQFDTSSSMGFPFGGSDVNVAPKPDYYAMIANTCFKQEWEYVELMADIYILITGLMANAALLWLLFREKRTLSASKVLGVNLAVMGLAFVSILPYSLVFDNDLNQKMNASQSDATLESQSPITRAKDIFSMFSLIGCPLLLACMCVERYLAVTKPVLYMRVKKWEYPTAVSAAVWMITFSFCLTICLKKDMVVMMLPVSVTISSLFIVMLTCLGGVVWSLWQQSPAHTTFGNQANKAPLKRRAVGNVLAVVGPAVMVYLPVLVMFPLVLYKFFTDYILDSIMCAIFELCKLFPKFGVLIGPMFYFSKARQICCPHVKTTK